MYTGGKVKLDDLRSLCKSQYSIDMQKLSNILFWIPPSQDGKEYISCDVKSFKETMNDITEQL